MQELRTQIGIVGAGPSGLLLSHLLHLQGIDSVVIEHRSRIHVESRIRAGHLEPATVRILTEAGVGERMHNQGLSHSGVLFQYNGERRRLNLQELTGQSVMIYGQREIVKDLNEISIKNGGTILFEVADVKLDGIDSKKPTITFEHEEKLKTIRCDFIVGCDGFHGVCRREIENKLTIFCKEHPFAWLGILAEAPPVSNELIYACHERGLGLFSMRSPSISRLYLQCSPGDNVGKFTDEEIWDELRKRLEDRMGNLKNGKIMEKSIVKLRSFLVDPMQFGRVFLVGDAAHIVPPSAAKGLNSAVADVSLLKEAFERFYSSGDERLLDSYTVTALQRQWETQRFSQRMTTLLHCTENTNPFDRLLQVAELNSLFSSQAAALDFAKSYVGVA